MPSYPLSSAARRQQSLRRLAHGWAPARGGQGDEDEVDRDRRGAVPHRLRAVAAAPMQQPADGPGRLLQGAFRARRPLDKAPGHDPRRVPGTERPERQGRPLRTDRSGVVGPGLPLDPARSKT